MDAVLAKVNDNENHYIVFTSWNNASDEIFNFLLKNEKRLRKEGAKNFFVEKGIYNKGWDVDTELINKSDLTIDEDEIKFNHTNQRHTYQIINPEEVPLIKNIH